MFFLLGVRVKKFIIAPSEFLSPVEHPPNACYCTHFTSQCRYSGFLDLSACYDDIPLVASKPYFLDVDPEIGQNRVNITATFTETGTYGETSDSSLYVHPLLGNTLFGYINMQLSLRLSPESSKFELLQDSLGAEYYVPFVHFWKQLSMDDQAAAHLRSLQFWHSVTNFVVLMLFPFTFWLWRYFICSV